MSVVLLGECEVAGGVAGGRCFLPIGVTARDFGLGHVIIIDAELTDPELGQRGEMWRITALFCFQVSWCVVPVVEVLILILDVCFRNVRPSSTGRNGPELDVIDVSTGLNGRRKAMRDSLVPAILAGEHGCGSDDA